MQYLKKQLALFFFLMIVLTSTAQAQFEEPKLVKIEAKDAEEYKEWFDQFDLTGQGFKYTSLDRIPAIEIRAKLQSVYGEPTKTIESLMSENKYSDRQAIQFEYWFIVDGDKPFMVLDLDGPFADGLVYAGASRYVDLLHEVKRTFTRTVTEAKPKEYSDYFYSPERNQWYRVSYSNGEYKKEKIKAPTHFKTN